MAARLRIKRTYTANYPPPAGSLVDGELAVEMASTPPRLWVGVPISINALGRVQLNDGDPLQLPLGVPDGGTGVEEFTHPNLAPGDFGIVTASGTMPLTVSPTFTINEGNWGLDGTSYSNDSTGAGGASFSGFRSHGGSLAQPAAVESGDTLAALVFGGFDGNGWGTTTTRGSPTVVRGVATENWTPTATGAALYFHATPNGTADSVPIGHSARMTLQGGLQIGQPVGGDPGPGNLAVEGSIAANFPRRDPAGVGMSQNLLVGQGTGPIENLQWGGWGDGVSLACYSASPPAGPGLSTNFPYLQMGHANGTDAAPEALVAGQMMGAIYFQGYDGVGWEPAFQTANAVIDARAVEDHSATAHGTVLNFFTVDRGPVVGNTIRLSVGEGVMVGDNVPDPGHGNLAVRFPNPTPPSVGQNLNLLMGADDGGPVRASFWGSWGDGSLTCNMAGDTPYLDLSRANGTAAAPTATREGNVLGAFNTTGYGTDWYQGGGAHLHAQAIEDFTATAQGTRWSILTTDIGAAISYPMAFLETQYGVRINTSHEPFRQLLDIDGSWSKGILVQTGEVTATLMLDAHAANNVVFTGRTYRGTPAARTAVQLDDVLAIFGGTGCDGTLTAGSWPRAYMQAAAAENWTQTTHGSYLLFGTTGVGTTTAVGRMMIGEGVRIGNAADPGNGSLAVAYTITAGRGIIGTDYTWRDLTSGDEWNLYSDGGEAALWFDPLGGDVLHFTQAGGIYPVRDNIALCGTQANAWSTVWAHNWGDAVTGQLVSPSGLLEQIAALTAQIAQLRSQLPPLP